MSRPSEYPVRERGWSTEMYRGVLIVAVLFSLFDAVVDAIASDWGAALHDLFFAGALGYVWTLERTLDRWERFVPPVLRKRP